MFERVVLYQWFVVVVVFVWFVVFFEELNYKENNYRNLDQGCREVCWFQSWLVCYGGIGCYLEGSGGYEENDVKNCCRYLWGWFLFIVFFCVWVGYCCSFDLIVVKFIKLRVEYFILGFEI